MSGSSVTSVLSRVEGLFLGSALGEAIGLERARLAAGTGGPDDSPDDLVSFGSGTQLLLFGAEGLLIAATAFAREGFCNPSVAVHHAYLRWLVTQGQRLPPASFAPDEPLGWLLDVELLHRRFDEGSSCAQVLSTGLRGTLSHPAPASAWRRLPQRLVATGLLVPGVPLGAEPGEAFHLGREIAALLEGSPAALDQAGALCVLVGALVAGATFAEALAVVAAQRVAAPRDAHDVGPSSDDPLEVALEIASPEPTLSDGLRRAVEAAEPVPTAALVGGLLGASVGSEEVLGAGLGTLEGTEVILALAGDVAQLVSARDLGLEVASPDEAWRRLYG